MTPEKRAKLEEEDLPLDLSVEKPRGISSQPSDFIASLLEKIPVIPEFSPLALVAPISYNIPESLLAIECQLTASIEYGIHFAPPVEYMYNPIEYAFEVHSNYVHKYCRSTKKLLFLGMNAGPWGMSQTGVPFGEVNTVTNFLELSGFIGKPLREHPARKVTGFACQRSEVSGRRFWSLIHKLCGTPETFFRHSFLHNYCPLALMDAAGRNITPAELKGVEQRALQLLCDQALVAVVKLLGVEKIVSVGRFTEKRAKTVIANAGLSTDVLYIPHPSPRSPSNINWVEKTTEKLRDLNLLRFFTNEINLSDVNDNPQENSNKKSLFEDFAPRMQEETPVMSESLLKWMDLALEKAVESLKAGEVPVGCLFIYENAVIATGNNTVNQTRNATRHAEINCIDDVIEFSKAKNLDYREVFSKIDVVVTVEPCIMCAAALHQMRVRSIVYGCANDRFGGCASVFAIPSIYEDVKISITGNVKGEEAMRLLKEFYKGTNPNAPEDKVKKKGGKKRKNNEPNEVDNATNETGEQSLTKKT